MKWWIIKVCLILWQPCEQTLVWTDGRQQRWEVQVFVLNRIADSQTVNWTDLLFESFRSFTGAALQRPLVAEVNVTNEQTTDPYERTAVSTDRVKLTRGRTAESWTNPFCFLSLHFLITSITKDTKVPRARSYSMTHKRVPDKVILSFTTERWTSCVGRDAGQSVRLLTEKWNLCLSENMQSW